MSETIELEALFARPEPLLALAPMQDVTDLPFMRLMTRYGGADLYFTEYFRVHADSKLHPTILSSITENPTGRPVIAQMIGNDVPQAVEPFEDLRSRLAIIEAAVEFVADLPREVCDLAVASHDEQHSHV